MCCSDFAFMLLRLISEAGMVLNGPDTQIVGGSVSTRLQIFPEQMKYQHKEVKQFRVMDMCKTR